MPKRVRWEVRRAPLSPTWVWFVRSRKGRYDWQGESYQQRKRDAIREARKAIFQQRLENPSLLVELFVYDRHGRIQDRRTYPRSSDPRRSKG